MNSLRILYLSGRGLVLVAVIFSGILLIPFHIVLAADEGQFAEIHTIESTGTVNAVHKDSLVIDDSAVLLDGTVQLYDQYGNSANQSLFEEGDQVFVASAEDEQAGKWWIVSIKLAKKGSGKKEDTSSGQEQTRQSEGKGIQKIDGVWTN
jgi:hypothetical protein